GERATTPRGRLRCPPDAVRGRCARSRPTPARVRRPCSSGWRSRPPRRGSSGTEEVFGGELLQLDEAETVAAEGVGAVVADGPQSGAEPVSGDECGHGHADSSANRQMLWHPTYRARG